MDTSMLGAGLAVVAGISMGLFAAPIKFMSNYRFEHWAFVNALAALILVPWGLAFALCPDLIGALEQVPASAYLKANLWSLAWGTANVLCGLCFIRIGVSLTMGLMTGVGLPVGILLPMVFKGSGQFSSAPSILAPTGLALLGLTLVLVIAVALMARAGSEREKNGLKTHGSFKGGLLMAITAGILSVGLSFAFVYSQGPLMEALKARSASELGAIAAVWAATLPGGALINVSFPLFLMLRGRNLKTLVVPTDLCLTLVMALLFVTGLLCMGNGMRMMGVLGASLGFGLQQGFQTLSSQSVGVLAGEWRGATLRTKVLMIGGVILVLAAVSGMAILKAK